MTVEELRTSQSLRADVATRLSVVSAQLEGMMVSAPRRAIRRRAKAEE
jgi:hypothetical protein